MNKSERLKNLRLHPHKDNFASNFLCEEKTQRRVSIYRKRGRRRKRESEKEKEREYLSCLSQSERGQSERRRGRRSRRREMSARGKDKKGKGFCRVGEGAGERCKTALVEHGSMIEIWDSV